MCWGLNPISGDGDIQHPQLLSINNEIPHQGRVNLPKDLVAYSGLPEPLSPQKLGREALKPKPVKLSLMKRMFIFKKLNKNQSGSRR